MALTRFKLIWIVSYVHPLNRNRPQCDTLKHTRRKLRFFAPRRGCRPLQRADFLDIAFFVVHVTRTRTRFSGAPSCGTNEPFAERDLKSRHTHGNETPVGERHLELLTTFVSRRRADQAWDGRRGRWWCDAPTGKGPCLVLANNACESVSIQSI